MQYPVGIKYKEGGPGSGHFAHAGRQGSVGGSVSGGGHSALSSGEIATARKGEWQSYAKTRKKQLKELPTAPEVGKPRNLASWKDVSGKEHKKVTQYGQLIYAPSSVGSYKYARAFIADTGHMVGRWTSNPINGKVKDVRNAVAELARLTDWNIVAKHSVAGTVSPELQKKFNSKVATILRPTGGR